MKRLLLITTILLSTTLMVFGQDTIYSIAYTGPQPISNFEDRDTANYFYLDSTQVNNIWEIGTPSKTIFNSAYSSPLALVTDTINTYPVINQSTFEFVIYTDDATFISFWHRFNTDSLADGGVIEVSTDNGSTWTNIINAPQFTLTNFYSSSDSISSNSNKVGFTGNSAWINSTIQGTALNFVRFRFTFTSDNTNTNKDGWIIDSFDFVTLGTSIEEIDFNAQIKLYPNPTVEKFSIGIADGLKLLGINVFDNSGRIISKGTKKIIETSLWPNGLYFIEIVTDKGIAKKKLIKTNVH